MDSTRADLQLRLSKLDLLHNAYRDALGLQLHSEDGKTENNGPAAFRETMCECTYVTQLGSQPLLPVSKSIGILGYCSMLTAEVMLGSATTVAPAHQPMFLAAGDMVFEFTQISATQPEKPYSFAVKVEGESFTGETQQLLQQQQQQCLHMQASRPT